MISFKL